MTKVPAHKKNRRAAIAESLADGVLRRDGVYVLQIQADAHAVESLKAAQPLTGVVPGGFVLHHEASVIDEVYAGNPAALVAEVDLMEQILEQSYRTGPWTCPVTDATAAVIGDALAEVDRARGVS